MSLQRLGVKRLLLAIQDVSFPSDHSEDIGRGSSATHAAGRLFTYASRLGFNGIQLGPQGQTTRGNSSPYDGAIFSRHTGNIGIAALGGDATPWLVTGERAQHAHAHEAMHALLDAAYPHRDRAAVAAFTDEHASWLVRDARVAGIELDRYAFGQWLAHVEHARVRAVARANGLALYGDLHVGYATSDALAYADAFVAGYKMGAPPSRTNPAGQPWGYPVLDPLQYDGRARDLILARLDKMFAEYDSVRVDHPHGLVCPWVYRADDPDPDAAVRAGARLFDSPDLADHPALARYAIARADQLDRSLPRYADGWVRELDAAQIGRYSVLVDAMIDSARRAGRDPSDLSFEVLSTMPRPLGAVLARHGLGRWRVLQKANLNDPSDVYRSENAARADWMMLGNHDTPPIFAVIAGWSAPQRDAWGRHLRERLRLREPARLASDGFVATAMLAELFASDAENVSIFFADLFGMTERFNVPGVVADANWSLRLPADFERLHAERLAEGRALDLPLAAQLARSARS
ncbi:MAG TPA: 4-alpha-glucanotransferase, partial [Kofleriaceae bacterium]